MITVYEIRDKTAAGSIEFSPKELSPADALKCLIKEFCQGAVVVDATKTELVLMVADAGQAIDQITFSGTETELTPLFRFAAIFQIAKFKNHAFLNQLFEIEKQLDIQATSEEDPETQPPRISKEALKSMPIAVGFYCPVFFGKNSQNLKLLLGAGKKVKADPEITDATIQELIKGYEQDLALVLGLTILAVHPPVTC